MIVISKAFNWHQEAQKRWDNQATSWNEKSMNLWDNGNRKEIIPFIESHLVKNAKILDIGCGDGYGSYKLLQSGYDVVGIDLSDEMIHNAKNRLNADEITFLQGDINDLSFTDHSYDGIMAINVLEWTEDPIKGLKELSRVLKKDGFLFIGILGPTAGPRGTSYQRLHGEKTICNTMMPWEFQQLASGLDFEYVDGFGVYKAGINESYYKDLPLELQQALTFMWVFMLRKVGD